MTIEFINEVVRLTKQNPEHVLNIVIERVIANDIDLKLKAQLMLVLVRLQELKELGQNDD